MRILAAVLTEVMARCLSPLLPNKANYLTCMCQNISLLTLNSIQLPFLLLLLPVRCDIDQAHPHQPGEQVVVLTLPQGEA